MSSLTKILYKPNDFIFFEGDIEAHFFLIEKGQITVFTKNQKGEKVVLAQLGPGEVLGEQAMIDKSERSATAQASSDCVLLKISEESYEDMLAELPLWASSMLKNLSTRLKHMNKAVKTLKL